MTSTGSCPCHPDIEAAVTAHRHIVETQARGLLNPTDTGYDDVISDGMLALWKALAAYDPERGNLDTYLRARIRFRMIDGLRGRTGRGAAAKPPTVSLVDDHDGPAVVRLTFPDTADTVESLHLADEVLTAAAQVDPRLPAVLRLLGEGYTRAEAGAHVGVSRTRVWQLMAQLNQFTQLTQRASA